jgi:hypothetical protein
VGGMVLPASGEPPDHRPGSDTLIRLHVCISRLSHVSIEWLELISGG